MKYFLYILESIRPNTWLRIWGEMIVAAVLASYPAFDFTRFITTFIATSPLLWSAAYLLNDITDTDLDSQHHLRKSRTLLIHLLGKKMIILIICLFFFTSLILGLSIGKYTFILLLILALSQILYTIKPARLKERFIWDVAINSVNSTLRYLLGWFSQYIIHPFSIYPLVFFVSIKTVFFIGHRMQNRDFEKKLRIKSTVTTLNLAALKLILGVLSILIVFFFILSIVAGDFPTFSAILTIIGGFPFIVYLYLNRKKLYLQEQTLALRNLLYADFFLISNLIALSILLNQ